MSVVSVCNDFTHLQLIENVLLLGCSVVGVLCALAAAVIAHFIGLSSVLSLILVSFGLLMGLSLASISMSVVSPDYHTCIISHEVSNMYGQQTAVSCAA
jgi:hypothetical protein